MNTKQVIVVRKDLNMSVGKTAAQVAHASMSFLTKKGIILYCSPWDFFRTAINHDYVDEVNHWLTNSFRKICVYVESEEELDAIYQKAQDMGLVSHMIIDNGATEFNGVQTKTVVAIGPHSDDKFIGLTDKLRLL